MANVVLYTKSYCPYSQECKKMLHDKGVDFSEMQIDHDPLLVQEMEIKSGGRTDTPQVFINDHHIGSFDDLKALNDRDQLDEMLNV